jgi:hypothetical protein
MGNIELIKTVCLNNGSPYLKIFLKNNPIIQTGYLCLSRNMVFNIVSSITATGVLCHGYHIPFKKVYSTFTEKETKNTLAAFAEHTLGSNYTYADEEARKKLSAEEQIFSEFIDNCYNFLTKV